jgi:hypothetical protein
MLAEKFFATSIDEATAGSNLRDLVRNPTDLFIKSAIRHLNTGRPPEK